MWREIYVSCNAEICKVRKLPIFVYEGKIYATNICDFGNGSKQCEKCHLKNNPELLSEIYTPDNPLYLKVD